MFMDRQENRRRDVAPEAHDRLESLDVLRGFAVLGIFAINIWHFGLPEAFYANPTALGPLSGLDGAIWHLTALLIQMKFWTLFSLLFGAGIWLMSARAGLNRHRRRMVFLLFFGLVHAYLIWPGDILFHYAVCGLFASAFLTASPRRQVVTGIAFLSIGAGVDLLEGLALSVLDPNTLGQIVAQNWRPSPAEIDAQIQERAFAGRLHQIALNIERALSIQVSLFLTGAGWRILGLMALGMALLRMDVLTARRSAAFYARVAVIGLSVGLVLTELGLVHNAAVDWDIVRVTLIGGQINYWASLFTAAGYAGALLWLVRGHRLAAFRRGLSAAGRVALTNYLLQSIIAVGLMQGLSLYGQFTLTGLFGIVLAVWAVQIAVSVTWLRMVRQGPFEALWRHLTYAGARKGGA